MHPNIYKAPADKHKLFDLGIQDGQVVVFLSLEEQDDLDFFSLSNAYKKIAEEFHVQDTNAAENIFQAGQDDIVNQDMDPIYQSPPRSKQKPLDYFGGYGFGNTGGDTGGNAGNVPAEYAHDPEFYYAI